MQVHTLSGGYETNRHCGVLLRSHLLASILTKLVDCGMIMIRREHVPVLQFIIIKSHAYENEQCVLLSVVGEVVAFSMCVVMCEEEGVK